MQTPEQQAKSKAWRQGAGREKRRAVDRKRQANGARRDYIQAWVEANKDWGSWWEGQRRLEDRADLKTFVEARGLPSPSHIVQGKGARPCIERPKTREFIMGWCPEDGKPNVVRRHLWYDSIRCLDCTKRFWRGNHRRRARHYDVPYEHFSEAQIFERDGYRCQICGGG